MVIDVELFSVAGMDAGKKTDPAAAL